MCLYVDRNLKVVTGPMRYPSHKDSTSCMCSPSESAGIFVTRARGDRRDVKDILNDIYGYRPPAIPIIKDIFYVKHYTTIKWSDGSTTTVHCSENDNYDKETGVAVAIAEKYFELLGHHHPRAALKEATKSGKKQIPKSKRKKLCKE